MKRLIRLPICSFRITGYLFGFMVQLAISLCSADREQVRLRIAAAANTLIRGVTDAVADLLAGK